MSLDDAFAIRHAAREHHIQVLVNYETTWYASNRAAYDEVAKGGLGDLRRIVVHDGHEGPKEIGVQPEFSSGWKIRIRTATARLRFWLLRRGPRHLADARGVTAERHRRYPDR